MILNLKERLLHMKKLESNFACRCSKKESRECDRVKSWVMKEFKCEENEIISAVVYALSVSYNASITGIGADQWAGVWAETYKDGGEQFSTFIQCDRVEDGFTYTLKKFYDRFGEEREIPPRK